MNWSVYFRADPNSLIAISEAIQEINRQVRPEFGIEIAIEGVGPGSFRAKIKTTLKSISGLFKAHSGNFAVNILAALVFQRLFAETPKIIVRDDLVIMESGSDRIIIPKAVWDAKEKLPNPQQVTGRATCGTRVCRNGG